MLVRFDSDRLIGYHPPAMATKRQVLETIAKNDLLPWLDEFGLVAGRSAKDVLPRLRHAIAATFRLLPAAAEDMLKFVKLWSLMRLQA